MISINILHVIPFYWYVHIRHLCISGTNCAILPKNELACRNFSDKLNKYTCMFIILLCLFGCFIGVFWFFIVHTNSLSNWQSGIHIMSGVLTVITQVNDKNLLPPWSCPFPRKILILNHRMVTREACPKPNNNDESLAMF